MLCIYGFLIYILHIYTLPLLYSLRAPVPAVFFSLNYHRLRRRSTRHYSPSWACYTHTRARISINNKSRKVCCFFFLIIFAIRRRHMAGQTAAAAAAVDVWFVVGYNILLFFYVFKR